MYFVIKLSKLCNLRCNYCYEYEELANKERMSLQQLEYFFSHVADYLLNHPSPNVPEFVFHGGEPLLLPHQYFRDICSLQEKYLDRVGINYRNSLQTNLFKISDSTLDLLQELNISLGVSFDVFGKQRVDIKGKDSQESVIPNLQRLIDRKINFGIITVLHAENIDYVLNTYQFCNDLGINYRILPISSVVEPPARMKHLMLSNEQILEAYKAVAKVHLHHPTSIRVYPLRDFFLAAVRYLTGQTIRQFQPEKEEWVLIINVNGDVYNRGDAYLPEGYMGNLLNQKLEELLNSPEHQETVAIREKRMETCRRCQFDQKCHQIHIAEATDSARVYNNEGQLECTIAKPMIEFMIDEIQQSPEAQELLNMYYSSSQELASQSEASINLSL